jgi:zinc/manganese transport system substrate-binding protein
MRLHVYILAAALLLGLDAGPAAAELKVVTTLTDLGRVAEAVGGDDVSVEVLCPGGRDPHYLPAKPSLARKLGKADLLCYNGLELEIGWLPQLIDKARNPRVRPGSPGDLDCSAALAEPLEVPHGPTDRGLGDVHPLGNPHYTLDPRLAAEIGRLMAERMARLDPPHAGAYRERADAFAARIAARLPEWESRTAVVRERPVVIYHRHWSYLAHWLGLDVVAEIEHRPGIAPSPRHVQEVIHRGRDLDRPIVVAAEWDHLDVAREVAERVGAPLAVLPGYSGAQAGTDDYIDFIDRICKGLREAAAAAGGE